MVMMIAEEITEIVIVTETVTVTGDVTVTETVTVTENGIVIETVTGTEIEIVTAILHLHGRETIMATGKLVALKKNRLKNRCFYVPVFFNRKFIFLIICIIWVEKSKKIVYNISI